MVYVNMFPYWNEVKYTKEPFAAKRLKQAMLCFISLGLFFCIIPVMACADHDEEHYMKPVSNPVYKQVCGACHFAYLPELLPSGSWRLILDNHGQYFGTDTGIDMNTKDAILQYLIGNAAEQSRAKRSKKIMKSIRGNLPTRITDIPYIREKHDEVSSDVFNRKSVGSFSNCVACHTTAEQGIFEDDNVVIPK